ncbi:MAG: HAD family phosphatase [Lachnospiraceae bacterium]|nr:HAD family phosphatase [Lachnospiraceae bacterium]
MIKNIVFDVGEVLLGYRWKEMLMEDHGLPEERAEKIGRTVFSNQLWADFDMGTLNMCDVIQGIGKEFPEYQEDLTWFIEHADLMPVKRPEVWKFLPKLREKEYKIYLLSNYSQELFEIHTKGADFLNYIDGKVVSYEIKIAKPDERIYRCLFDRYGLRPEECIFLDDRKENVEAAEKLGMKSIQIMSEEQLIDILKTYE